MTTPTPERANEPGWVTVLVKMEPSARGITDPILFIGAYKPTAGVPGDEQGIRMRILDTCGDGGSRSLATWRRIVRGIREDITLSSGRVHLTGKARLTMPALMDDLESSREVHLSCVFNPVEVEPS